MSERLTPRQRARRATIDEIKRLAREQLSRIGSSGISLREIARELNIVSSAVYRYFPSRDELLTELIIDAYDALGNAAERAAADRRHVGFGARWVAVAMAIRQWALANPSEYALVYGSPVPGYHAPGERTIPPATRVPAVLLGLLRDLVEAGGTSPAVTDHPTPPAGLADDLDRMRAAAGATIPDGLLMAGLAAWSFLFGAISLEVFGQLNNVITDRDAYFEHQARRVATSLGLNVVGGGDTN